MGEMVVKSRSHPTRKNPEWVTLFYTQSIEIISPHRGSERFVSLGFYHNATHSGFLKPLITTLCRTSAGCQKQPTYYTTNASTTNTFLLIISWATTSFINIECK